MRVLPPDTSSQISRLERHNADLQADKEGLQVKLNAAWQRAETAEAALADGKGTHRSGMNQSKLSNTEEFNDLLEKQEDLWNAEKEHWNQERARMIEAHIGDVIKLERDMQEVRENDTENFR